MRGRKEKGTETRGGGRTGKAKNRFRSFTRKKLQSELKTHDKEIASMHQEHWAETQELWEEMVR